MKKKLMFLLVITLILLPVVTLASQESQKPTFKYFSVDFGYFSGFDLDNEDFEIYQTFGFDFRITDTLIIGYKNLYGLDFFNFKTQLNDKLRLGVGFAPFGPGTAFVDLGIEMVPFAKRYKDTFTTEFRLGFDYYFTDGNFEDGLIGIKASVSVGL